LGAHPREEKKEIGMRKKLFLVLKKKREKMEKTKTTLRERGEKEKDLGGKVKD